MAVTTVAAYILVVTLAAPSLTEMGVPSLVAHFAVFYWAMLSAFTPPVAGVCVVTANIAQASFLKTCWESMKLGSPKFIMPFYFISYPAILSFSPKGFIAFFIAGVGFVALSAGIQSAWGWWQQGLLIVLGAVLLLSPPGALVWVLITVTLVAFPLMWKRYSNQVVPVTV
jgi:TRAP-type uncharacterized transport system fused permease subunit